MTLAEVTRVMHNLLEEGIPIRDITIVGALSDHNQGNRTPDDLTRQVRIALGPAIYQTVNGTEPELSVMVLDSRLEQMLMQAVDSDGGGIEPTLIDGMIEQVGSVSGTMEAAGTTPVLLVASNIRSFLSRLLRGRMANFASLPTRKSQTRRSKSFPPWAARITRRSRQIVYREQIDESLNVHSQKQPCALMQVKDQLGRTRSFCGIAESVTASRLPPQPTSISRTGLSRPLSAVQGAMIFVTRACRTS